MSGDVTVSWNGREAKIAALSGAALGVTKAAEHVRGVSVARTPLDFGDLRSSQVVVPAENNTPVAAVTTDLPYAVRQHEGLHFRHRHGRAKFLESALLDERDAIQRIIAVQVRRALGGA